MYSMYNKHVVVRYVHVTSLFRVSQKQAAEPHPRTKRMTQKIKWAQLYSPGNKYDGKNTK